MGLLVGFKFCTKLYVVHFEYDPLCDVSSANTFPPFSGRLFVSLMVFFAVRKLFSLTQSPGYFLFCLPCPRRHTRKIRLRVT